jgi:hypothetical protein
MKSRVSSTTLEWHSIEEVPPLHTVQYAGESWLQSNPLLLVNQGGKMAVGYCHQGEDGTTRFEVSPSSETLRNVYLWAVVQAPGED